MSPINYSHKHPFITFGLRRRQKTKQLLDQRRNPLAVTITHEVGSLQLFNNHAPKVEQKLNLFTLEAYKNLRKPTLNGILAHHLHSSLILGNNRLEKHQERMERDQAAAQNRHNGWLANDRQPK